MSGYRKALKILSIIEIVLAVLALLVALASMGVIALGPEFTDQSFTVEGTTITVGQTFAVLGALALIGGVIDLLTGCLGVRAANNPEKIGFFFVLVVIDLIFNVVELVLTIVSMAQGTATASTLVSSLVAAAISFAVFYITTKVKAEGKAA